MVVLTAQRAAADAALSEIQRIDAQARPVKFLSPEARLVTLPGGYDRVAAALRAPAPDGFTFTRHLFPVQYSALIEEVKDWTWLDPYLWPAGPTEGASGAGRMPENGAPPVHANGRITVQLRVEPRDDSLYSRAMEKLRALEAWLADRGWIIDNRDPAFVVSIFVREKDFYAGFSRCTENRSAWNGGERRFKKDAGFISRAEFKLLEAFEAFSMDDVRNDSAALDLGAAPGGWTKALLERGYRVVAADPAQLHERLADRGDRLIHFRDIAQKLPSKYGPFDLITNDMRLDMYDSCRVMLDMADRLKPEGRALMTLKLSPGQWRRKTGKALALLSQRYTITGARQLFHNRDEVTVYLTSAQQGAKNS